MKVTAVETLQLGEFPVPASGCGCTPTPGLVGTGETFWAPGPVAAYIHDNVAPYLIGQDPRDIELHDRTLGSVYVGARNSGRRGARQLGGQHRALGHLRPGDSASRSGGCSAAARTRRCRSTTPAPATATCGPPSATRSSSGPRTGRCKPGRRRPRALRGPARLALRRRRAGEEPARRGHPGDEDLAVRHRGRGARWGRGSRSPTSTGRWSRSREIRDAVGREMEIMVELHGLWTLPPALRDRRGAAGLRRRLARGADPLQRRSTRWPSWRGAPRSRSPPASGWRRGRRSAQLIARRAASIIMIDLAWCGGLSEARKIANMAEASRAAGDAARLHRADRLRRELRAVGDAAERLLAGGGARLLCRLVPGDRRRPAAGRRRAGHAARRAGARAGAPARALRSGRTRWCGGPGDDRQPAGPGDAARALRADGAAPPLRDRGAGRLPQGRDAGLPAPLHRRGGDRGRGLRPPPARPTGSPRPTAATGTRWPRAPTRSG